MSKCVHDFRRNTEAEVICVICGDKDDEMEAVAPPEKDADAPVDFWATQTSFE